jgi:hypothetical protein
MKPSSRISGAVALTVVIMAAPIAPASAASGRGDPESEVALLGIYGDWLLANAESGRCIAGITPVDLLSYLKNPGNAFDGYKTFPVGRKYHPLAVQISGSEEGKRRVWSFFLNLADCNAAADNEHDKLRLLESRAEVERRAAISHRDGAIDLCQKPRRMTENGCQ